MHRPKLIRPKIKTMLLACLVFVGVSSLGACHDCTLAQNKNHAHCLPPDPGAAGKATLEGIDSDNDGLRDDLQRLIFKKYDDEPEIRQPLIAYTKASQAILLEGANPKPETIKTYIESVQCMANQVDDHSVRLKAYALVKAKLLNTKERTRAYNAYQQARSGSLVTLGDVDCN